MNNKPILRWLVYGIVFMLMYALAFVLFPIAYLVRDNAPIFLWWFLNDETLEGEDWWLEKNGYTKGKPTRYQLFRWNVIRNSHWNFKMHEITPGNTKPYDIKVYYSNLYIAETDIKIDLSPLTLCNKTTVWGESKVFETIDG